MKLLLLFLFVAVTSARCFSNTNLDEQWKTFKKVFNKNFNDAQEEVARRQIWEKKVNDVITHNLWADLGVFSYRRGINEYSDMDHKEFVKMFNGYKHHLKRSNGTRWVNPFNLDLPKTVDWRQKGLVTPVKNQEQCGSCWAFSTTGSLEGQHMKKTGKLVSLSEQNLVDCSGPEGNMGCEGGLMDSAFQYIKQNNGIDTESSYPYTAEDGDRCLFKKSNIGATCSGYVDIPSGDENALKKAVATIGPISVAIDASHESFQSYQSGIYNEPDCSSDELDHGVLVVGYGTEDGTDYWLVKNSWGTSWGMKGYLKMSRNANNQCGIATQASYPLV